MNTIPVKIKILRIKQLCELSVGKKFAQDAKSNGKYNFYTGSKEIKKTDTFSQKGPAILFSGGGHCARLVFFVKEGDKFESTSGAICLSNFNEKLVNPLFLYYWLMNNLFTRATRNGWITKTTIEHLYIKDVKNLAIPIPEDLEYQKRVVEFLNLQMEDTKKLHELYLAQLKVSQKLRRALIHDYTTKNACKSRGVDLSNIRIKNFCCLSSGKKLASDAKEDGQYDFYTGSKEVKKIDTFTKQGPAILISGGQHIEGQCIHLASIDSKFDSTNHAQALFQFRDDLIDFKFLYYLLKDNLHEYAEKHGLITRTTIPMLNRSGIKNIELSIPKDVVYQKKTAEYLDRKVNQLDEFIELTKKTIKSVEHMQKSIIQDCLEGGGYFLDKRSSN